MNKYLILIFFFEPIWGQNPCEDERYLRIWNTPYHELTKREYDYYLEYDRKCNQWNKNKVSNGKIINFTKNIKTNSTEVYRVEFVKVPMRDGASTNDEIIRFLYAGDKVIVHSDRKAWFLVEFFDDFGWVYGDALVKDSTNSDYFNNWNTIELNTGDKPPCHEESIMIVNTQRPPLRRFTDLGRLDVVKIKTGISLTINTPEEFQAIINIIDITWDKVIKTSYINSGDSYTFKNIPEGDYQLKIEIGNELILRESNDNCELVFKTNPLIMLTSPIEMKITTKVLDFGGWQRDEYEVPKFNLNLNTSRNSLLISEDGAQKIKSEFFHNERY